MTERLKAEVDALVATLQQTADGMSMDGRISEASLLLSARQAIRVLWTKLETASQEKAT